MKVTYTRSYPIGAFLQEKIGFEIEVEDPSTADETIEISVKSVSMLKGLCDKAHKELNPDLEAMQGTTTRPVEETVDRRVGMVDAIEACTNLGVLKTFALLSKSNPEHRAAYEKRFAELSE